MECPWCGEVMHKDDDSTWVCINGRGPRMAGDDVCPLRGEPMSQEQIERTEISLIDAEQD